MILLRHAAGSAHETTALEAVGGALADGRTPRPVRALLVRVQARLLRHREPHAALRVAIDDVRAGGAQASWIEDLRDDSAWPSAAEFDAATKSLSVTDTERSRVEAFRARVIDGDQGVLATVEHHLALIVRLCEAASAQPVLLNYPDLAFAKPDAQQALRRTAKRLGVDFLDVSGQFAELANMASPGEYAGYFIADGHCNSRGYALIGELVASHTIAALR